jgi:hypothetical protein
LPITEKQRRTIYVNGERLSILGSIRQPQGKVQESAKQQTQRRRRVINNLNLN